ncbi:MAG: hypothetical protein JJU36_07220 [Phycisphaeraceae bacterium]|nr:hypothetical protein [Phycisphaeraceae bacterium]
MLVLAVLLILGSGHGCAVERHSAPHLRGPSDAEPSVRDYAAQEIDSIIAASSVESLRERFVAEGFILLALTERFDTLEAVRAARGHGVDAGVSLNDLHTLIRGLYRTDDYVLTERMDRFLRSWIREIEDREVELVKRLDQELKGLTYFMHESLFWVAQFSRALHLSSNSEIMAFARRILSRDRCMEVFESEQGLSSFLLSVFPLLLAIEDGDWREAHRLLESGIIDSPEEQRLFVSYCSGQLLGRMDIYIWVRDRLDDPEALFQLDVYTAFAFPDQPDAEKVLRAARDNIIHSSLADRLRCDRLIYIMGMCGLGGYWNLFDEIAQDTALCGPPYGSVLHLLAVEGEFDRLDEMLRRMDDAVPELTKQILRAEALSFAGRRGDARKILDRIDRLEVSAIHDLQTIAYIYARIGDIDTGIDVMRAAHKQMREFPVEEGWWAFELSNHATLMGVYGQSGASLELIRAAIDKLQLCNASRIYVWSELGSWDSSSTRVLSLGRSW